MSSLLHAWPAIRSSLQTWSFYDIKEIVGLAGLDLTTLAHLEQKSQGGASKGQLMTAIDGEFGRKAPAERSKFLFIVGEEILRRKPEIEQQLSDDLSRHGWRFSEGALVQLEVFDPTDLSELPEEALKDLLKAAQRFRDGDLSGAISAACGAVDSATSLVYQQAKLGDPGAASFQERYKRASSAKGVIPALEELIL